MTQDSTRDAASPSRIVFLRWPGHTSSQTALGVPGHGLAAGIEAQDRDQSAEGVETNAPRGGRGFAAVSRFRGICWWQVPDRLEPRDVLVTAFWRGSPPRSLLENRRVGSADTKVTGRDRDRGSALGPRSPSAAGEEKGRCGEGAEIPTGGHGPPGASEEATMWPAPVTGAQGRSFWKLTWARLVRQPQA